MQFSKGSFMESRFFKLSNGLNIHANIEGQGPLVICLSGYANSNHNFKLLAPYLAQDFTLCMIDARGMGKSDNAMSEYKMNDLAQDALEIAELMGAREFGVIGISLGGYPAQLMAMDFPNKIKFTILIATRGPGKEYEIIRPVTEEGFTAFMNMDPILGNRLAVELFVHPDFIKNHPDKLEAVIELRRLENKITLNQSLMQLRAGFNFIESDDLNLNKITSPVLIISGENDCFLPQQNAHLLQKNIKNSELVFIPKTSHLCFFEKPQLIAENIIKFYKKL
jgi:pimeloyl-ACP methyl ester carboxylesterase